METTTVPTGGGISPPKKPRWRRDCVDGGQVSTRFDQPCEECVCEEKGDLLPTGKRFCFGGDVDV
jgi:hypothetical protein